MPIGTKARDYNPYNPRPYGKQIQYAIFGLILNI